MDKVRGSRRGNFGQRIQEVENRIPTVTKEDMEFLIDCADALGLVWSAMENISNEFYMEDIENGYETDVKTIRSMVRSFDVEKDVIYRQVILQY